MKGSMIYAGILCVILMGCMTETEHENATMPYVKWDNPVEAGKYLVTITGCNDCHTDGYLMTGGQVPEENWLTGSAVGWQGPWGTTYPTNLRLRVQEWDEDLWVKTLKERKALPPMPWMNLNKMSSQDMRSIYTYIKSLGPKGEHMPLAVAPGVVPQTPYLSMFPQNMPPDDQQ